VEDVVDVGIVVALVVSTVVGLVVVEVTTAVVVEVSSTSSKEDSAGFSDCCTQPETRIIKTTEKASKDCTHALIPNSI